MRAPFPYFGGKSAIADEIWKRLGTGADAPRHYIEPFAGSLAVLLARPGWHPGVKWVETINDLDGLLVNVWRSLALHPDETARHAQWPVSELDLHARHAWLRGERGAITERLLDPEWCDPRAAGWWLWCAALCVGSDMQTKATKPRLTAPRGQGVIARPDISGVARRVRRIRAISGGWRRCMTPTLLHGDAFTPCAVYLDPPYGEGTGYAVGENKGSTAADVWVWALDAAERWPDLRIAVSGYDDGRNVPDGWGTLAWDANDRKGGAGYGNVGGGQGRTNARRERVWFSPGCLSVDRPVQLGLLEVA